MHGQGVYAFHNGNHYDGQWECDVKQGKGTMTYVNGERYEGEWKAGKKHGQGVLTFINGAKYEGGYKEDLKHYKGRYTHADGSIYVGCVSQTTSVHSHITRSVLFPESTRMASRVGVESIPFLLERSEYFWPRNASCQTRTLNRKFWTFCPTCKTRPESLNLFHRYQGIE